MHPEFPYSRVVFYPFVNFLASREILPPKNLLIGIRIFFAGEAQPRLWYKVWI
jgi:hypothetical protein